MQLSIATKYVLNSVYPGTVTGLDLHKVLYLVDKGYLTDYAQAYRFGRNRVESLWSQMQLDLKKAE